MFDSAQQKSQNQPLDPAILNAWQAPPGSSSGWSAPPMPVCRVRRTEHGQFRADCPLPLARECCWTAWPSFDPCRHSSPCGSSSSEEGTTAVAKEDTATADHPLVVLAVTAVIVGVTTAEIAETTGQCAMVAEMTGTCCGVSWGA